MKMGNFERKMEIPFSISANTSKIYYIAGASGCGGWMDGPWWNEIGNVSIGIDIPNLLLFCRTFGCLDANDEVLPSAISTIASITSITRIQIPISICTPIHRCNHIIPRTPSRSS